MWYKVTLQDAQGEWDLHQKDNCRTPIWFITGDVHSKILFNMHRSFSCFPSLTMESMRLAGQNRRTSVTRSCGSDQQKTKNSVSMIISCQRSGDLLHTRNIWLPDMIAVLCQYLCDCFMPRTRKRRVSSSTWYQWLSWSLLPHWCFDVFQQQNRS